MTELLEDEKLPYAERIAKLLRKAEATDSQHEAEALTAKAQQLMRRYAISEALLAVANGNQAQDEVVQEKITYTGVYSRALYQIGAAIGKNNGCKVMITQNPKNTILWLVGFKTDVNRVKLLDASIQIQAATALPQWWREQDTSWMGGMQKFKARREFLFGYAQGLSMKLAAANRAGMDDAVQAEAARTNVDETTVRTSTELVLRSRKEQVEDWYDKTYGRTTRTARMNYSHGGYNARAAGQAAGRQANTGTTGLGRTTRGSIGSN